MAVRYVEYIESNGTQYINTKHTHTANTRIEMECTVKANSPLRYGVLFGARLGSYTKNCMFFFVRFQDQNIPVYSRTGAETKGSGFVYDEKITIIAEGKTVSWYKNEELAGSITTTGTVDGGANPLFLLNGNTSSAAGGATPDTPSYCYVQLSACRIIENGTIEKHYRAAIDDNDVACLYEEVSKSYDYGVGTFTAGPIVVEPAVDFGTVCRMPLRIGTPSGGGSAGNIPVTITGSGDASYCYALINNKKYTSAQTVTAKEGDKITLCIYSGGNYAACIYINDTEVFRTYNGAQTYEWEVPSGCAGISMEFMVDYDRNYSDIYITTE